MARVRRMESFVLMVASLRACESCVRLQAWTWRECTEHLPRRCLSLRRLWRRSWPLAVAMSLPAPLGTMAAMKPAMTAKRRAARLVRFRLGRAVRPRGSTAPTTSVAEAGLRRSFSSVSSAGWQSPGHAIIRMTTAKRGFVARALAGSRRDRATRHRHVPRHRLPKAASVSRARSPRGFRGHAGTRVLMGGPWQLVRSTAAVLERGTMAKAVPRCSDSRRISRQLTSSAALLRLNRHRRAPHGPHGNAYWQLPASAPVSFATHVFVLGGLQSQP